jgi:hypothetical protein
MAGPLIYDRVKETTTTTGVGTVSLAGAATGFRSFVAAGGGGNSYFYVIESPGGSEFEGGIGTVTAGTPDTLSRTTVLFSSNGGALVNFSAGTKNVFNDLPAAMQPTYDPANGFWGWGTTSPAQRMHVNAGWLRFDHAATPGACSAALAGAGAGNVDNGTHVYWVTFVTAQGEGARGTATTVTVANKTTNGQVSLTSVPLGAAGVTSRKIYRSVAGGGPPLLLTTLADNTTTTYTDNTADASLGAVAPSFGSTAGKLITAASPGGAEVDGPVIAESGRSHGFFYDRGGVGRNVRSYGAVGGTVTRSNGAMTATSATLTSTGFVATDVGKLCSVSWAGTNQIANPTVAATVSATGGGTTGGLLAAGIYRVKYTWTTRWGETTAGTSESGTFTAAAGNIPRVTLPSLPANALAANIYLTPVGGTTNTEVLYATGVAPTTYDLTKDAWPSSDATTPPTANTTAGPLNTVITGFTNSTTVTLADAATTTVSSANVMWGWDDTAGIQAAIDAGTGLVQVPSGSYLISQIKVKTNVWLWGSGWGAQLNQRGGASGHMVILSDADQIQCGVVGLKLDGQSWYQTSANDGIHFDNTSGSSGSDVHNVWMVYINNVANDGVYFSADVGEAKITNCYILNSYRRGIYLDTAHDCPIIGTIVGQSGERGVYIHGANNRLTNCKSFNSGRLDSGNGPGFYIDRNNNELTGCEGQDNQSHAFHLVSCSSVALVDSNSDSCRGDAYRLDGCTDCVVRGHLLDSARADQTSVINFVNSAIRNEIQVTFTPNALASGTAYVQGTTTGNNVHVGPDGGYQAPSFPSTQTVTVVAATDVFTSSGTHGLGVGDPVFFTTSNTLPAPLALNTPYYVKTIPSTTTFTLAPTTALATTVDITTTGTGTHTMQLPLTTNPYAGNFYKLTLTANLGIAAPTQQHQGQKVSFEFTQDATGGRQVAWGSVYQLRNWSVLTRPSQVNSIDFVFDGTNWVQHGGITDLLLSSTMGVTTSSVSSATTAETKSLVGTVSGSFTCPPTFMSVGRKLRLKANGVMSTGATAGTVTFQIKFAGTVIASTGAIAPTISLTNMYWEAEVDIVCRSVGASGTLFVQGKWSKMNATTSATTSLITWPIRGNSADPPAAVTVDTTVSSLIDFQSITSNNLHTITCNMASLEVLN